MKLSKDIHQKGVAFIEFAICLPLFLLLLVIVVDGSRVIQERIVLDSLAREIIRTGAGIPELETGTFSTDPGDSHPQMSLLWRRAAVLFVFSNLHGEISSNTLSMSIVHQAPTVGSQPNVLRIRLEVNYQFLLGLELPGLFSFNEWPIVVEAEVPRLF